MLVIIFTVLFGGLWVDYEINHPDGHWYNKFH